jgi:hypothetical protein
MDIPEKLEHWVRTTQDEDKKKKPQKKPHDREHYKEEQQQNVGHHDTERHETL